MDRGAWQATVYGATKSWTRLSDFTFSVSIVYFGEGNGNPLQCSCLENPHGQRSQVGYSPQGRKELDTTERLSTSTFLAVARGLSSGSAGLSSCGGRAQLPGGM